MKNAHLWRPSKFVNSDGGLIASRDPEQVNVRSRILADRLAAVYQALLREHATGALLDVGCGRVPLYGVYRDLVDEVVCVDWAGTPHPSPFLDVEADLNQGLPLPDERFDTVLATDVLEHLARPDVLFAEATRVLRPGGKLILGVPFLYHLHEVPHDYHRYTRYRLARFCEENGLSVVSLEAYGGHLAVLLVLIGKTMPGWRFDQAFQKLGSRILASARGKRLDESRKEAYPLGYYLVARKDGSG